MSNFKFSNEVWSLIPARSGSKRIKNKNLKKIGKLSLVAHAIKISKKTKYINRTFLSTDSNNIKLEGKKYEAEVPFLRSKETSRDHANDYVVIKEFLILGTSLLIFVLQIISRESIDVFPQTPQLEFVRKFLLKCLMSRFSPLFKVALILFCKSNFPTLSPINSTFSTSEIF